MDPLTQAADIVDDLAEEAAEQVDATTDAVGDLFSEKLDHIRDLVRVNGEAHSTGLSGLSDRLAAIESRFTDAAHEAVESIAEIAEEGVDTVADAPSAVTDEIEAVIESPESPPEIKRKGMIGSMKGRKGRRS